MDTIKFSCSGCGKHYAAPAAKAGARGKCVKCGAAIMVPRPGEATEPGERRAVADRRQGPDRRREQKRFPPPDRRSGQDRRHRLPLPLSAAPMPGDAMARRSPVWFTWAAIAFAVVLVASCAITLRRLSASRASQDQASAPSAATSGASAGKAEPRLAEQLAGRSRALSPTDAKGRLALASWCRENRLDQDARRLWEDGARLAPEEAIEAHRRRPDFTPEDALPLLAQLCKEAKRWDDLKGVAQAALLKTADPGEWERLLEETPFRVTKDRQVQFRGPWRIVSVRAEMAESLPGRPDYRGGYSGRSTLSPTDSSMKLLVIHAEMEALQFQKGPAKQFMSHADDPDKVIEVAVLSSTSFHVRDQKGECYDTHCATITADEEWESVGTTEVFVPPSSPHQTLAFAFVVPKTSRVEDFMLTVGDYEARQLK